MSPLAVTRPVDAARFLEIATQGAAVATYAQLWRWLQGDVQALLPHDAMLIGWGDFRSGDLHDELVSGLRGARARACTGGGLSRLVSYLRDCWVAAQHRPCEVELGGLADLLGDCGPRCTPAQALADMRTAVVHGVVDAQSGGERIFAAFSARPRLPDGAADALTLVLPFIDTAMRRMPVAAATRVACERGAADHASALLSERERQIMEWVAMGKTNPEIGCILRISEFTVKNHMKSIFGKLDVSNRAQAVARLSRVVAHA